MLRLPLTLLAIALLVPATAGSAAAEGYYGGFGVGPGAGLTGDFADRFSTDGEVAGRFHAGRRWNQWSGELSAFGTDLSLGDQSLDRYSTLALGVGARYFLPLQWNLELYLRGGLDHTWLGSTGNLGANLYDGYSGAGLHYGTGLQWRSDPIQTKVGRLRISAWADVISQQTQLKGDNGPALQGSFRMVTFGITIGSAQ